MNVPRLSFPQSRGSANERSQYTKPTAGVNASAQVGSWSRHLPDRTAKRWQDDGQIIVRYLGRQPFVDIPATAQRSGGRGSAATRGATSRQAYSRCL